MNADCCCAPRNSNRCSSNALGRCSTGYSTIRRCQGRSNGGVRSSRNFSDASHVQNFGRPTARLQRRSHRRQQHQQQLTAVEVSAVVVAAIVLCLQQTPAAAQVAKSDVYYGLPYQQCTLPPTLVKEKIGASTDAVLSLCLKTTSGLTTTFDNADKIFIGNDSNPDINAFGTLCAKIEATLSVAEDNQTFAPTSLPAYFTNQAWDLSVWSKETATGSDSGGNQTVVLTISNNGNTVLRFSGIDYEAIGLSADFNVSIGTSTQISFDKSNVKLDFNTLPLLESYLSGDNAPFLDPGDLTAAVIIKYFFNRNDGLLAQVAYAMVQYTPGSANGNYNFFLYEAEYFLPAAIPGAGRRLLALPPVNRSPPAGCARGCCKPAVPIPPACRPGTAIYPTCLTSCGCFCR